MSTLMKAGRPVTAATVEAVYADLAPELRTLARSHVRRNGGDRAEAEADAGWHFLTAYLSHDPERGPLAERVAFVVRRRLAESRQAELKRQARHESGVDPDWGPAAAPPERYPLGAVTARMSPDGRRLVALLFEPPEELDAQFRGAEQPGTHSIRRLLRAHVRRVWGWDPARTDAAFQSVSEAL